MSGRYRQRRASLNRDSSQRKTARPCGTNSSQLLRARCVPYQRTRPLLDDDDEDEQLDSLFGAALALIICNQLNSCSHFLALRLGFVASMSVWQPKNQIKGVCLGRKEEKGKLRGRAAVYVELEWRLPQPARMCLNSTCKKSNVCAAS